MVAKVLRGVDLAVALAYLGGSLSLPLSLALILLDLRLFHLLHVVMGISKGVADLVLDRLLLLLEELGSLLQEVHCGPFFSYRS